ncbi:phage portal protein [Lederbergia ruris]|uniref:Phage portal protein n=1 Tax=Lederbergia ruris TaxID=217495 RepID=A0ABQ4KP09_9BACI|nr:phage portal protein [Lederbergia ruris]GIN59236.1 phage portal protein [Lederbergia ruris]
MRLFGREIRSQPKTVYSLDDKKFAKLLGIELDDVSADKAKEATFYACLRIMTDSVSKLPLKLHKSTEDGTTKENGHYLYNLMKLRPNPFMSSSTFWKMVEFQRLYYGHSVVAINHHPIGKDAGKVKSLVPLEMDNVEIWIDDKGILGEESNPIYYIYTDRNGKQYKFKNSEVLHFLGMTKDGIQGMAIKDYLKTLIDNAQASTAYTNNYLRNGLHSKGIISYVGDLDEGKQKALQERFKRLAGGVSNSGSLLPLPIGFDYKSISTSMADAQFKELSELSIQEIASAFGVKPHQINSLEQSTHSNIEHQQKEFYVETLQPILTQYEQELTYKLLTSQEVNDGYFFRFNVDVILRSDSKERAEYITTLVEKGVITSNEARGLIDMPKLEGGDKLIVNGSYIPIDLVGTQYGNHQAIEGGDDK